MKKLLLAVISTLTLSANATGNYLQPSQTQNYNAAVSVQGQSQNNAATASSGGNSVDVDNDTRMPASSAISPSVGTGNDCQIATPSSKAFSILIMSVSGTAGVTYNDLCFAYKMKQFDVAEKLMCAKSKDYAKANPNCK